MAARRSPGGHLTGHACLVVNQPGDNVLLEGLVPFSPNAPMGEAPLAQPGQQGVVCHPGYQLQALQQSILGNIISQWRVVQYVAITICMQTWRQPQLGLPF